MGTGIYGRTFEVFFTGSHFALSEEFFNPFTGERMRAWQGAMEDAELGRVKGLVEAHGATLDEGAIVNLERQRTDPRRPYLVLHDFDRNGGAAQLFGDFDICCAFVFALAKAGDLLVADHNSPSMMATSPDALARALAVPDGLYASSPLVTSASELREAFGSIVAP